MQNRIGTILIVISLFMLFSFPNADIRGGRYAQILVFIVSVVVPFIGGIFIFLSNSQSKKK